MLDWLRDRGNERKLRLFACACCRRLGEWLKQDDPRLPRQIERAEELAEAGQLWVRPSRDIWPGGERVLFLPSGGFWQEDEPSERALASEVVAALAGEAAWNVARQVVTASRAWLRARAERQGGPDREATADDWLDAESRGQAALVRDVFGHLWHTGPVYLAGLVDLEPVTGLARAIYAERSFGELPILADALEDAGCTDEEMLEHCREPGEHIRGCWVVDAVLGKS
jgi:hypothetical protein